MQTAVGLFIGIWLVRYLGPERFGLLSYAISVVVLFSTFASLGLDVIIVREMVKFPEERDDILGTALILKLIGGILVLTILTAMTLINGRDKPVSPLILIIAAGLVFQSFNVIQFFFESKVQAKNFVYAQLITTVLVATIRIILILMQAPLLMFAVTICVESLFGGGCLIAAYKYQGLSILKWRFAGRKALNLLRDSWSLILSGLAIAIYMRIDQIMIKHMLGNDAIGQYAAAVRLSEAWNFMPLIVCSSLFPAIITAKKRNKKLYHQRLEKLYNLMIWMAMAIALPTTFLSRWGINLLYGEKFSEAGTVLMIYIWATVFAFFGTARGKWLINENLQRLSFYYLSMGCVVNIILNFIFIQRIGIAGAAFSTIISLFFNVCVFPLFNVQTRGSVVLFFKALSFGTLNIILDKRINPKEI